MALNGARVDLSKVYKGLDRMHRAGKNLSPVFASLVSAFKKDQILNARSATNADGTPWDPISKKTLQARTRAKGKSARKRGKSAPKRVSKKPLGKLVTAIDVDFASDFIRATDKAPWAGIHQHGGTAGRKGFGFSGSKIPPRVHRWISDDFLKIAAKRIAEYVAQKF